MSDRIDDATASEFRTCCDTHYAKDHHGDCRFKPKPAIDRVQLGEAIRWLERDYRMWGSVPVYAALLKAAAQAHLATLPPPPEPEDHIIVGRKRRTGEAFIWAFMGKQEMTAANARKWLKTLALDYPGRQYTAVKLPE